MARREEPREDLIRDATALVQRAALKIAGEELTYVLGLRSNGSLSVFCGEDPVFQFDSQGLLRRVYLGGERLTAREGRLFRLIRQAESGRMAMRHERLAEDEETQIIGQIRDTLGSLRRHLQPGAVTVIDQFPRDSTVLKTLSDSLDQIGDEIIVARSPHAR